MPSSPLPCTELDAAIETFVRGFAVGRSRTHPYLVDRVGTMWRLYDAPRKSARDYRKDEWIARGVSSEEVDRRAREQSGGRYAIGAVVAKCEDDRPLREGYKRLGYRLMVTEPLFVHRLRRIPRAAAPAKIVRINSDRLAAAFGKATRTRPLTRDQYGPGGWTRQYAALDGERGSEELRIVGWVACHPVGDSGWVSNMEVIRSHRRRGIGKALLGKLLRDDRAAGLKRSVLTATHTGALLYPTLGYEQVGTLLAFVPRRG